MSCINTFIASIISAIWRIFCFGNGGLEGITEINTVRIYQEILKDK